MDNLDNIRFRKGGRILTLDELVKQKIIFVSDSLVHNEKFMDWTVETARQGLEQRVLYYAIKDGR